MRATEGYKFVLKCITKVEARKNTIINKLHESTCYQMVTLGTELEIAKAELELAKEFFYTIATAEEIHAIYNEELITPESRFSSDEYFNKAVLIKDKYCTHEEYSKDFKLQALMPKKRF